MVDFLWSGKCSKIAYSLLIQEIDHGGLALPDLENRVATSLLSWIRDLWFNPVSAWAAVLQFHLKLSDIKEATLCKMNWALALPDSHPLLKQILSNWAKFHIYDPETEQGVKLEILWHNNYITVRGETLNWTEWKVAGIKTVNDLWHPTQTRFL